MSYWLGLGDAMGSLAGGEQSAMQPPVRLQLAKIAGMGKLPEEELEDEPEEDELPDDEVEDDPPDDEPDDEPDPDPELPEPPPELLPLPGPDAPHPATPRAIKPIAQADHVTRVIRSSLVEGTPRPTRARWPKSHDLYKYRVVAQTAHARGLTSSRT
jgi:hypothetical protein